MSRCYSGRMPEAITAISSDRTDAETIAKAAKAYHACGIRRPAVNDVAQDCGWSAAGLHEWCKRNAEALRDQGVALEEWRLVAI